MIFLHHSVDSPLLLATGPVAYLVLRFLFRMTPRPETALVDSARE